MISRQTSLGQRLEAIEQENKGVKAKLARAQTRCRVLTTLAAATIIGGLLLFQAQPATAQGNGQGNNGNGNGNGGGNSALEARVAELETRMAAAENANTAQNTQIAALQASDSSQNAQIAALQTSDESQNARLAALEASDASQNAQIAALQSSDTSQNAQLATMQTTHADHETRIVDLEWKTQFLTVESGQMRITNTNLHILNGTNDSQTANGNGNLIVGYNHTRDNPSSPDVRTGSHNIVTGDRNNYTSWGGIVAGQNNQISNEWATVTGGTGNKATGAGASVSGGNQNTASGFSSSISGGRLNRATADYSSVSGGWDNLASAFAAAVSGGRLITQATESGWSAGSLGVGATIGNFRSP